jgi:hypothetical protein
MMHGQQNVKSVREYDKETSVNCDLLNSVLNVSDCLASNGGATSDRRI